MAQVSGMPRSGLRPVPPPPSHRNAQPVAVLPSPMQRGLALQPGFGADAAYLQQIVATAIAEGWETRPPTAGWWCPCCNCDVGDDWGLQAHLITKKHMRLKEYAEWCRDLMERERTGSLEPWIEVRNCEEFCTLCQTYATDEHKSSSRHRWREQQWREAQLRPIQPAPVAGSSALVSAGAWTASGPPPLPEHLLLNGGEPRFYEWKPESYKWYCKLCRKYAEEGHTTSKIHTKRATWPDDYLGTGTPTGTLQFSGAPPPPPPGAPPPHAAIGDFLAIENAPAEEMAEIELSPGWNMSWEESADGSRPFYYIVDDPTAESTWEKPPLLPPGWRCRFSQAHERFYFFQVGDDGSYLGGETWEQPQMAPAPPPTAPPVSTPVPVPVPAAAPPVTSAAEWLHRPTTAVAEARPQVTPVMTSPAPETTPAPMSVPMPMPTPASTAAMPATAAEAVPAAVAPRPVKRVVRAILDYPAPHNSGYLNLTSGQSVGIIYDGSVDTGDADFLYGCLQSDPSQQGWFLKECVERPHSEAAAQSAVPEEAPRPATSAVVARRLVHTHLQMPMSQEARTEERQFWQNAAAHSDHRGAGQSESTPPTREMMQEQLPQESLAADAVAPAGVEVAEASEFRPSPAAAVLQPSSAVADSRPPPAAASFRHSPVASSRSDVLAGTNRPAHSSEESRPAQESHMSTWFGLNSDTSSSFAGRRAAAGRGTHIITPNFAQRMMT